MNAGRSILLLVLIMMMCAPLIFCDTSSTISSDADDDDADADDDSTTDDDDDSPDNTPPDPPEVEDPISPTGLTYQSVRGTAEAGAMIEVTGGLADAETVVDANGEFCVKVALRQNEINNLEFVAEDEAGNTGEPVQVVIEQQSLNLSLAGVTTAGSTSSTKPDNTPDKANDGSYLTWWENTTNPLQPGVNYRPQWLGVKLAKTYWLDSINIYWGRDALTSTYEYGTKFDVYLNTEAEPAKMPHEIGEADPADYGYVFIEHIEQNPEEDIQLNAIDLADAPVNGRWVFLFLHESNRPVLTNYSFEVAELETYGFEHPDVPCD